MVEFIHTQYIIFREYIAGLMSHKKFLLTNRKVQFIIGVMKTPERSFAMIYIILTLPQIEINDVDGIYFLHFAISVTQTNIISNRLRHSIKHAMKIIQLTVILYLDNQQFAFFVFSKKVDTIKLICSVRLVRLTLQEMLDMYLTFKKSGKEAFQYHKVCLVTKQSLHGPIESYIIVRYHHIIYLRFRQK